ncbi:hypothetical protein RRG08_066167 [Elysia crispata]|uniref:LTD domain-containing protein n=1 Tax=Elysia crispata TaxID=231223 RepID=A0AAE0YL42_9GAST|nr:hypothetical protein RRG08_066167 [Elysia crispata]
MLPRIKIEIQKPFEGLAKIASRGKNKKKVFKDLRQIQEEDGSQLGEITLIVPSLPLSGVDQPREPGLATPDPDLEVKPAACPFGDRIAKERAEKELKAKPPRSVGARSQQVLDESFPRNVLLRQREQKQKNAQRPRTAGVNPASGRERGRSFISTRSYISDLTDPPLSPTSPPPISRPRAKSAGSVTRTSAAVASAFSTSGSPFYGADAQTPHAWNPSTEADFLVQPNNIGIFSSGVSYPEALPQNQSQYKPDPSLAQTVNPHCPPRQQIYGSAAYQLRDVDRDRPAAPTTVADSKVNQYLHHNSGFSLDLPISGPATHDSTSASEPPEITISRPDIPVAPSSSEQEAQNAGESNPQTNGPQLQFLRENCASPVPISKQTLFLCPSSSPNTLPGLPESETVRAPVPASSYLAPSPPQQASSLSHVTLPTAQPLPYSTSTADHLLAFHSQQLPASSAISAPINVVQLPPAASVPPPQLIIPSPPTTTTAADSNTMTSYVGNMGVLTPIPPSRVQEKEELQRLNERFSSYISRVRQLGQAVNAVDSSAFLRSSKILEDEIVQLKAMYEAELAKLRRELEASGHERNSLYTQHNKQQKQLGELTDRLSIETDKTNKLMDEINLLQRKNANLEAELQDVRISGQRPQQDLDNMARNVEALTREVEAWKHRYEHEQVARQELEDKNQQLVKKVEFADSVHGQQVTDYQSRLDTASAAILNLEARVRELSTADMNVSDMIRQVREAAEAELRSFLVESEEQYSRNLSALKAQIDADADTIQRMSQEKTELMGSIGELHAKIRNLEGQVANLSHQRSSLEDMVSTERRRAADQVRLLEVKVRQVQEQLVVKMREVSTARESQLPLKAEIEALKAMLEEEERRLRVPLGIVPASLVQQPTITAPPPSSAQIMATPSLSALKASTQMSYSQASAANQQQAANLAFVQSIADANKGNLVHEVATTSEDGGVLGSQATVIQQQQPLSTSTAPAGEVPATTLVSSVQQLPTNTTTTVTTEGNTVNLTANYNYSSSYPTIGGPCNPLYPYEPSPPLNTLYIPESLRTVEEGAIAYDADYAVGQGVPDTQDYEMYLNSLSLPMSGPRYHYETTPSVNKLHLQPSPPLTPRAVGPIQSRIKSAPATTNNSLPPVPTSEPQQQVEGNLTGSAVNLIPANLGSGKDYFDQMFSDLHRDALFSKPRPKSSPLERRLPSTFHDYTVSTSSAIGDLKILEVNQDGKFVRLVNDGPTEFELGGYLLQQNVGGHPVAVFRFPPRTKFAADSTITVWAAMNDPHLHNPPTDFFWREQQKWGTGPECTTILCRANGQAVAWTTAAHRFSKDAFEEVAKPAEGGKQGKDQDDLVDDESLTELALDANGPRPEPVYLRREKQAPPSLNATRHPHGCSPAAPTHPGTGQARPLRMGNDNSSVVRQSRSQTQRPDPVPGQPFSGAPAQRCGSAPLRKMGGSQVGTIRGNKSIGFIRAAPPSPFLSPSQVQAIDETRDRAFTLIRFSS